MCTYTHSYFSILTTIIIDSKPAEDTFVSTFHYDNTVIFLLKWILHKQLMDLKGLAMNECISFNGTQGQLMWPPSLIFKNKKYDTVD